ncbi:hypothetical protein HF265_21265 [Rhizobium leguminosarum]|uniref:hypothetical protein n=1 Tax=Rhizobium leguminosarum TaxID=384 RepID=UPI0004783F35|nr:hypothetical protein [Rhizobium leguminosarum]MBY3031583.1 hypothetical protein [Rhizobium leguminosarum]
MSRHMTGRGPSQLFNRWDREIPNPRPLAKTANVLCKKHNSELHHFDTAGTKLLNGVVAARALQYGSFDLNGNDIERFLMQRLCAHTFSNMATVDGARIGSVVDQSMIEACFTRPELPAPFGLYTTFPPPQQYDNYRLRVEFAPICNLNPLKVVGCRISFGPLSIALLTELGFPSTMPLHRYRPAGFRFWKNKEIVQEIRMHWESGPAFDFQDFEPDD